MTNYAIDPETGALSARGSHVLPSRVQYGWDHPVLPVLYAACADRGAEGPPPFYLCALRRDEAGDLTPLGETVVLPARPIHMCTDGAGRHVLVAYGDAPGLSVFELGPDGSIGAEIERAEGFEFGTKPHQVRVMPGDGRAVLVARGAKGFGKPAYVEGAFKIVRYDRGRLENVESIAPAVADAPRGFNPRNVDFHPSEPLLLATLEAQNELAVFRMAGDTIDPVPLSAVTILANPDKLFKRQDGGEVHVHPDGRHVYVANRNDGNVGGHSGPSWLNPDPLPVFPGGENNVAVFALDAATGRTQLLQHVDTLGLHPRTIALVAGGKVLVAGNVAPILREDGALVPASVTSFRIADDGRLTLAHKLDLDVGAEKVGWMGVAG
nr:beta-propeller fold lactonase family protein [Novosphingobium flavum]